jgi:hypothetical protein
MRLCSTGLKVALVLLAAPGLWQPSQAQQTEAPLQDGLALAKAMQVEKAFRMGFEAAIQKKGGDTTAELDCIRRTDVSFANDIYAAAFVKKLKPEEIDESVAFFSKPVGQWYLEYSAAMELQSRGVKVTVPSADISQEMYDDLSKFVDSPTGKKVLERREHETPELRSALAAKATPIVVACMQKAAPGSK